MTKKVVKMDVPFLNSDHSVASVHFSYRSIKNENDCLAMYDGEILKIIDPMTSRSRRIDKDTKKEIISILAELLESTTSNDSTLQTENAMPAMPATPAEETIYQETGTVFTDSVFFLPDGAPNPIIDKIVDKNRGYLQRMYSYCKEALKRVLPAVELLPMAATSARGYYGKTSKYVYGKVPVYKISLSRPVLRQSTILQAIETCCHEFAHLSHWHHGLMHAVLTQKYLSIVVNSLTEGGE